jgi:uncharacterized protein YukE
MQTFNRPSVCNDRPRLRRHHQDSPRKLRRGTTQMELALFMPLYAAMIMLLFTVFSFARTRSFVAIESRHQAWLERVRTGRETERLDFSEAGKARSVGRILNGSHDPAMGLVMAEVEEQAGIYLKSLNLDSALHQEHFVLTDPWDYQSLPFAGSGQHPGLQLDRRALVFGSLDPAAFSGLTGRLAESNSNARELAGKLSRVQQEANQKFNQVAQQLNQQIDQLRQQIRDLKKRLADLQKETPPDLIAIRDVYQQIQSASGKLTEQLRELSELNRARPNLSLQPSSSESEAEL